jgi:DNA helicase-2/ATP-dependent DNA helicase PcrA
VLAVRVLKEHPEVLTRWRARFRNVLVDEFQDTNLAQWELVRLLTAEHRNVMAVGDTDQSIYSFRGADFRNIVRFEQEFPEASIIILEQNYRSTQRILDAANAVIANNAERRPKHLWTAEVGGEMIVRYLAEDEHDEASWLVDEVGKLLDTYGHDDIAVLYRTNAQSRVVEETLVRAGLPYRVIGGTRFYDRREVKDALSYLRALVNSDDEVAWRRIINTPRRGVGDTSVNRVAAHVKAAGMTFRDALRDAASAGVSGKALGGIRAFLEVMTGLEQVAETGVAAAVNAAMDHTGYRAELEADGSIEAEGRLENLAELVGVAAEFDEEMSHGPISGLAGIAARGGEGAEPPHGLAAVAAFLEAISLVTELDAESSESALTLMTLHAAKGLEFPIVFLVGMEDGVFPHQRSVGDPDALEEERRLCYVGITRARERLYLSHAWSRTLFGATEYYAPSRFLAEIPAELMEAKGEERPRQGLGAHRATLVESAVRRSSGPVGARGAERLGLNVGDDVSHEIFGEGVIVDITGRGDDAEAVVRFREGAERRLILAWAPLRKL